MPLTLTEGGPIPHYATAEAHINNAVWNDATDAIQGLTYPNLTAAAGQLVEGANGLVRIDMQGVFHRDDADWSNIQIQINGLHGHSTIACAEVNRDSINTLVGAYQVGALRKVKTALGNSLGARNAHNGHIYTVTGDVP